PLQPSSEVTPIQDGAAEDGTFHQVEFLLMGEFLLQPCLDYAPKDQSCDRTASNMDSKASF
uniref:Uncharacterized protein n=1 Tax=Aegilops tauschii subsp. strangulata TaxID=200361 RepID=A0A453R5M1_AEGTS